MPDAPKTATDTAADTAADATPAPRLVPLAEIDAEALARDRTRLDEAALDELRHSIAITGLRMPIEIFALAEPHGPHRYGLISGFRRLAAFRSLLETTGQPRFAAIPAFLREPASIAEAVTAMVEENAIRADLSPWEQGMTAVTARDSGLFANIEAAVDALHPAASQAKRSRLRALARLAETLDGQLTAPETLTQKQALRLAGAVRAGYAELIRTALGESRDRDPDSEWALLQPILSEAERGPADEDASPSLDPAARRPRRVLRPRHDVTVRREYTRSGWVLHFTGRGATGMLMDTVMDEIERMYSPG